MDKEIIATALEQLAYAIKEYPIHSQLSIKTFIANDEQSPEVTFQFSVQKTSIDVKGLEVEIAFWRSDSTAVTLVTDAFSTETGESILHQVANLSHLDDAYPYLEQALNLFNLEKME